VVLRYIPAPLNPTWTPGARLYYALDALGAETRLRHDVFDAIHNQHSLFPTDESAFPKWVAGKGVDAAKFSEVYASFTIMSKVQRANQITRAAGINGTPGLVVAGKYKVVEPGALSLPTNWPTCSTHWSPRHARTASSNDRVQPGARHPHVHVGVPRFHWAIRRPKTLTTRPVFGRWPQP
jgi:hypothetical protein